MLKRYAEALPHLREAVSRAPNQRVGHVLLPATHAQLTQQEEARAEAIEVLRIDPSYTIDPTAKAVLPFKLAEDAEHLWDALRKAGVPET